MAICVNNLQDKVDLPPGWPDTLAGLARAVIEREGCGEAEVSVVLVDDGYIQALNREYRGRDEPTDVLSFALREREEDEPAYEETGPEMLGDVFVSVERARVQAEEMGHSLRRELAYLAVHGLLHLLGYDHDRPGPAGEMRSTEEAILEAQGLGRDHEAT